MNKKLRKRVRTAEQQITELTEQVKKLQNSVKNAHDRLDKRDDPTPSEINAALTHNPELQASEYSLTADGNVTDVEWDGEQTHLTIDTHIATYFMSSDRRSTLKPGDRARVHGRIADKADHNLFIGEWITAAKLTETK